MIYARAYVQYGAVVALHTSSAPISIIVAQGCDVFELTLEAEITSADLTYADGAVTGTGVLSCTAI